MKEIGDGLLLTFDSATSAVECSIAIQEATKDIEDLNLRIGIHEGEITLKDGDALGDDVNVASRIEAFAPSGGIAISSKVQQNISSLPEYKTKYLGQPELKGVNQEVKIKSYGMIIRLISLSRDSRCEDPSDKFSCMHDPKIYITFQMSAPKYVPESITIQKPQTEITGGVFHDFPFSIEKIEPPPQKNEVIEQSKYKVTMKVH